MFVESQYVSNTRLRAVTVDISSFSGKYYISFVANSTGTMITEISIKTIVEELRKL